MGRLFGTDGVRGIANKELTSDLAFKLGQACAHVLAGEVEHVPKILVGTDTRISCDMLECALFAGLCSVGADVIKVGVIPTPGVAYLTRKVNADASVVISASHNSFEFNGIKFFDSEGFKLPDEIEDQIEEFIVSNKILPHKTGKEIGRIHYKPNLINEYIDFLVSTVDIDISGMSIVIDCANGAAYDIASQVFKKLDVNIMVIGNEPNGLNINENCGSTHTGNISNLMKSGKYIMGFAYDGDADRVIAIDELGKEINGDKMLGVIALSMKQKKQVKGNTIVATVMSNMGLQKFADSHGLHLVRTKVGDRYVIEEMKKSDFQIGGEQSGHVIIHKYNTTGDGILTSIKLLEIIKEDKINASTINELVIEYPQVIVNAKVKNRHKHQLFKNEEIMSLHKQIEEQLHGEGRIVLRPSGTEPVVRVMIEGRDCKTIQQMAEQLATLVEKKLG